LLNHLVNKVLLIAALHSAFSQQFAASTYVTLHYTLTFD